MTGVLDMLVSRSLRAVAVADSVRTLSATGLAEHARALAAVLRRAGCRRLGLHADNGIAWLVADFACQEAEVVCVPLPLFFTESQMQHAIRACGIDAILTMEPARFDGPFLRMGNVPSSFELSLLLQPHATVPPLPPETGKVTFTSGSTGTPKGVCLGNAQQLRQAAALKEAVGLAGPVHLCALPLATLLENIAGVYAPLLAGGTVLLRTMAELGYEGSRLADPGRFLAAVAAAQPQTLILIPQLLQLLVGAVKQGWQPPPLQFIAVGGARVGPELIGEARRLGLPVYEGYGLTECASVVSLNTPRADQPGSCGRPLPHLQIELVNEEIHVAGNPMLGYVGDAGGWHPARIATGDLGSIDAEGFLHIAGRRKNLLISSYGRNISPEWVESELLAAPALREAVVFGDARPHCIALLGPARAELPDAALDAAVAAANARLPDYAQVKQWLRLPQPLAGVPGLLTPNGRPVRERIFRMFQSDIDALYRRDGAATRVRHDHDEVMP